MTVNSVTRLQVEQDDQIKEVIVFDQTVSGKTGGLGNSIKFWESKDETSVWYEPVVQMEVRWNAEKEEMETITKQDFSEIIPHYLYEFNKTNIQMIKEITRNNLKRVMWYVKDTTGLTRTINSFEEWSSKPFESLKVGQKSKDGGNKKSVEELEQEVSELRKMQRVATAALQAAQEQLKLQSQTQLQ